MADVLAWLQRWYDQQCNGDWEHHAGITISSLDNPGWLVRIQLRGTALEHQPFTGIARGTSDEGWVLDPDDPTWLHCRVVTHTAADGPIFEGASGPLGLAEILSVFREWTGWCTGLGCEGLRTDRGGWLRHLITYVWMVLTIGLQNAPFASRLSWPIDQDRVKKR